MPIKQISVRPKTETQSDGARKLALMWECELNTAMLRILDEALEWYGPDIEKFMIAYEIAQAEVDEARQRIAQARQRVQAARRHSEGEDES